jgi:hypothetical protein
MSWHKFVFSALDVFKGNSLRLLDNFQMRYLENGGPQRMTLYVSIDSSHDHVYYMTPIASQFVGGGIPCEEPQREKDNLFPIMGDSGAPRPLDRR